jgi:hypothetical protein
MVAGAGRVPPIDGLRRQNDLSACMHDDEQQSICGVNHTAQYFRHGGVGWHGWRLKIRLHAALGLLGHRTLGVSTF